MPCAGLIEMPPEVEAHTLADKCNRLDTSFATVPAHDHDLRLMRRALRNAKESAHAELSHGRQIENLDQDAELPQAGCTAGKFAGKKHIGGLVDEIARPHHPIGDAGDRRPRLLSRGRIGARKMHVDFCRPLLPLLRLGLVAIKPVGAQARSKNEVGNLLGLQRPRPEFGDDRGLTGSAWNAPHGYPAKLHQVAILEVAFLAGAHHNQARNVEPGGCDELERRPAFAGKAVGGGGAPKLVADRGEGFLRRRPEFEALSTEHNENSPQAVE